MENKKPQSTPKPLESVKKTAHEKSGQPSPQKAVQPTKAKSEETKQTASQKAAQSAQKAPERKESAMSAKVTQPKKVEQVEKAQPMPAKAVQSAKPEGAKPKSPTHTAKANKSTKPAGVKSRSATSSHPTQKAKPIQTGATKAVQTAKPQMRPSALTRTTKAPQDVKPKSNPPALAKATQSKRAIKPIKAAHVKKEQSVSEKLVDAVQKEVNTEGKTKSTKRLAFLGQKASQKARPVKKADATKVPDSSKVDKPVEEAKQKTSFKAKLASKFKKAPKDENASNEREKGTKQRPEDGKEASKAPTTDKRRSAIAKLATKGFVIKSWQIAVAAVVVIALVVGGVLLGTIWGNEGTKAKDPIVDYTGPIVDTDPENPSNITLPGYSTLMFPANSQKVKLELPNPSGNPCYFRYTLTVVETGDVLYESEWIDPGKMVKDLTLRRSLSAGTYTLRITIDTFSLQEGNAPMNGGLQEVGLIVK